MKTLLTNARLMTLQADQPDLGIIENGAILLDGDRILQVASRDEISVSSEVQTIDCEGRWISPGLIDCHTHLVHAGNRAREFEMRLNGATYEEIARAGGGIVSSVSQVRSASEDDLIAQSLPRLDTLLAEGVTTVEIKSGYGLT